MYQLEIGLVRTPFHSLSAELQPFYEHLRIRVSLKTQNVSQRAPPGIYAVSICGGPPKKFSEFYLKFWPLAPHICFWVHHNGKRAPGRPKISNFQILGNCAHCRFKPNQRITVWGFTPRQYLSRNGDFTAKLALAWQTRDKGDSICKSQLISPSFFLKESDMLKITERISGLCENSKSGLGMGLMYNSTP